MLDYAEFTRNLYYTYQAATFDYYVDQWVPCLAHNLAWAAILGAANQTSRGLELEDIDEWKEWDSTETITLDTPLVLDDALFEALLECEAQSWGDDEVTQP